MTSAASESVATILCSSKQTRFQITNHREVCHRFIAHSLLTIDSLILMESTSPWLQATNLLAREKQRQRARALRFSLGPNFDLRKANDMLLLGVMELESLVRKFAWYCCWWGANSDNPALLKAIAEKLIPGIPEETRIAILQQTRLTDEKSEEKPDTNNGDKASVLEQVIEKATAKHAIEQDIKGTPSTISTTNLSNSLCRSNRRTKWFWPLYSSQSIKASEAQKAPRASLPSR